MTDSKRQKLNTDAINNIIKRDVILNILKETDEVVIKKEELAKLNNATDVYCLTVSIERSNYKHPNFTTKVFRFHFNTHEKALAKKEKLYTEFMEGNGLDKSESGTKPFLTYCQTWRGHDEPFNGTIQKVVVE